MNIIERNLVFDKTASTQAKLYDPQYLVLHHEAGNGTLETIHEMHKKQGWGGIAYHFYIRKDGAVYKGRPMDMRGAHCKDYNYLSLGICCEGNYESEEMCLPMLGSLTELVDYIRGCFPGIEVKMHRELVATACPGKHFPEEIKGDNMEFIENAKLEIYVNSGKKTMAQIQKETGCDAIINAGLFERETFKPIAQLKVDGKVHANEDWGANYGIGWTDKPVMDCSMSKFNNFIGCICMVRNGKETKMSVPADMRGARYRSAFGLMSDGRVWLYATSTNTTPETLQKIAVNAGVQSAIMLDGGGSTQAMWSGKSIKSSRIVHNYILAYSSAKEKTPEKYTEPTANIRQGSTGEGAKWVQDRLNQNGYSVTVDGIFGAKSKAALVAFQKAKGLTADGICGKNTREVLKQ